MTMKTEPLFNKHAFVLALIAVCMCVGVWYINKDAYHFSVTQLHGQVGYNFYRFNSCNINSQITDYVHSLPQAVDGLVEYAELRAGEFDFPEEPFPVNDTIGYGVVLGLLWKVTDSLKFRDVQIVQIFLFSWSIFLVYYIACVLFASAHIARACCIALILYTPLLAQVVLPVRDVWAYFGMVALLYGILRFICVTSYTSLVGGCLFFALCQWVRPTVFLGALTVAAALIVLTYIRAHAVPVTRTKCVLILGCLFAFNIGVFWIPFISYNYHHYKRAFVGPAGQDLVEGLGEFANPWGYQLSDEWIASYIEKKYGVVYGTPEFDDKAKMEFMYAYKQRPGIFWLNMVRRIPMLVMPALPWLLYKKSTYGNMGTWQEKAGSIMHSPRLMADFLLRHVYIRLFLLLGYVGLFFAWRQRYYGAFALGMAVILGGWGKLPSHIEYRYLVPFYWVFCLFVGFAVWNFCSYCRNIYFLQKLLDKVNKRDMDL